MLKKVETEIVFTVNSSKEVKNIYEGVDILEPVLSVIIPVYNRENFLERCVKSVAESSLKNIEIILVDDGSVDNTSMLCDKLAREDSRILVIHQQNTGVSAARNRGLEKGQGKYFAFVDSDDYIEPDMYEKMVAVMEENDADMVCCGISKEYEESGRIEKISHKHIETDVDAAHALKLLIRATGSNSISVYPGNKIGKRNIQLKNRIFFDENIYETEDGVFWCDYIVSIRKAILLNDIFYHYVIHGKNVSSNCHIGKSKLSNLIAWEHIIQKCRAMSEQLVPIAELRYQMVLRKMIFEAYCACGCSSTIKSLLPQLKCYRKQLFQTRELSLSRKIYYVGCGIIVKYNLGHGTATLWKMIKEVFRNYLKKQNVP